MPRLPRDFVPGYSLYVIQRGHNRQDVFLDGADGQLYLKWLAEAADTHGLAIYAYVLMTNHLHLLVTPEKDTSLPLTMKATNQKYTPHINRRTGRTGTLWEGRYRSTVVESERYFMAVSRYIELNPVRAGLASDPASYRWSSFRHNALGRTDSLITPHELYMALGPSPAARQAAYLALFDGALDPVTLAAIRQSTHKGWALGDDAFAEDIAKQTGRRTRPQRRGPRQKPK